MEVTNTFSLFSVFVGWDLDTFSYFMAAAGIPETDIELAQYPPPLVFKSAWSSEKGLRETQPVPYLHITKPLLLQVTPWTGHPHRVISPLSVWMGKWATSHTDALIVTIIIFCSRSVVLYSVSVCTHRFSRARAGIPSRSTPLPRSPETRLRDQE